jgi:hypothetical protein
MVFLTNHPRQQVNCHPAATKLAWISIFEIGNFNPRMRSNPDYGMT